MELKIYNKSGVLVMTASPNTSSSLTEEVGGECSVSATFTHTAFIMLDVDSYIELEGVRYKVKKQYRPKQKNTQTYEYSVKFYAPIHDAEDVLMLFTEGDITSEFNYDGGPREHLQLWIDNMNRLAGENVWSIGTVISAENKTIEYKNLKCWDAAFGSNGIAATFETEMWADGFVINLCKASRGEQIQLGYLSGLTNLAQEDNGEIKFFTRLFPLGSTRNIDASKYGYSRLQLPSRAKYVDKNVDLYGVKEEYEESAFSGIYPKYEGTVSSVRTENKTNEEGRDYTVYYFKDSGINFNPDDYAIPEYTYKLEFQTGELAGRGTEGSFEAAWHNDTKEWEIVNVYPDDTTQIPGGAIIPKSGDKYIPWNFTLPQEYITAAEQAYKQAVDNYLNSYSFDPNKYTGTTDRNFVERNNTPLKIGWNVRLLSEQYFTGGYKDTRITKVVRKLNDLCQATITCTDQVGKTWKTSVNNQLNNLQYILTKQEQQAIIDIIKTTDSKTPSDYNVLSALKAIGMFHRKDKTDENPYLQKFLKGIELGKFVSGLLGTGGAIQIDKDGNSFAEFDYLTIRKVATFFSIIVQEMKHVGGAFIVSPSGMTCSKVEETSTAYRCYFDQKDGEKTIHNQFTVGTQARRQTFNLENQAYYWRLVTGIGDDYIDLSKTDCDTGSTRPQAGDEIVGLGHRTDKTRQSAIIISAYGTDSPSIKYYQGIDSYSLVDKAIRMDYYDPVTGRFKSVTYGDTYVGSHDESTYFSYNQDEGARFKGKVLIEAGSTGAANISDLGGYISENVQVGAENLLLNTGFTGNYETEPLTESKNVSSSTQLYSKNLENWDGSATVIETEESASGYAVTLGTLSQTVSLIANESYVISYKAKNGTVNIQCGNFTVSQTASSSMERYSHNFTFTSNGVFSISGTATVCEIKLERGTIATDWRPSRNDRNPVADMFKSYWYLTDALQGITTFEGGLGLTSIIRFGQWKDGVLQKVNACVSGIYNDDDDVAFSAGGDLDKAIYTVMLYKNNPSYIPTSEESKKIANCVITHSGRAILNDLIARGYIYATGGVFNGKVYADGGEFNHVVVADISSKNGTFAIDAEGNTTISNLTASGGTFTDITVSNGNFTNIEVDGLTAVNVDVSGKITATSGSIDNVTVSSISSKNGSFSIDAEGNTTISNLTASGGSFNDINVDGLTAVNVDISGKITATSGSIQNVTVKSINSSASDFYIDEDGNVKIKDLAAEGGTFTDIDVDGLTAVNADISGKITATSGKIGGWSISGNNLECAGFDTKILVEASGTRFMRINAEEKIMCYVRSDESTGMSIAVHGNTDDAVGLKVRCNAKGEGYAIKSYGNVLLDAREGECVELYGLTVNVRKVDNSSNFALQTNDDFIEFNNASAMLFNMSSNSKKGKIIYMKKISAGNDVTLTGGFRNPDGVGVSTTLTISDEKSRIFVYDGNYWVQFYCG